MNIKRRDFIRADGMLAIAGGGAAVMDLSCEAPSAMGAYAHTAKFICDWKNPVVVETSGKPE